MPLRIAIAHVLNYINWILALASNLYVKYICVSSIVSIDNGFTIDNEEEETKKKKTIKFERRKKNKLMYVVWSVSLSLIGQTN